MPKIIAAFALAGLLAAGSAQAQVFTAQRSAIIPQAREACAADVQTFCMGLPHVRGAVRQCLAMKGTRVSPKCRTALGQMSGGFLTRRPLRP